MFTEGHNYQHYDFLSRYRSYRIIIYDEIDKNLIQLIFDSEEKCPAWIHTNIT